MKEIEILNIDLQNRYKTKEDFFTFLSKYIYDNCKINDKDLFFEKICEREKISSTNIGNETAIPHVEYDTLNLKRLIVICKLKYKLKWDESTEPDIKNIILFVVPESMQEIEHLKGIASICRALGDELTYRKIYNTKASKDLLEIILDILK